MYRFAVVRDPELRGKLTPPYDLGREAAPTFSNNITAPSPSRTCTLQTSGIDHIEPHAIVANDGTRTEIDTLVLATGFDLWEPTSRRSRWSAGRPQSGKWWRENRFQAYQGVSVPYFPNYLSLASPYAFIGLNFFNTMEYQMRIMDRLLGECNGGRRPSRSPRRPTPASSTR